MKPTKNSAANYQSGQSLALLQTSVTNDGKSSPQTGPFGKTNETNIRQSQKVRTLIIDDTDFTARALAKFLAAEGAFTLVATATIGCRGIGYALTEKPDLVLMDYRMPHLNGIDATRYIKQFKDAPLIIIITSDDTPEIRALAKAAGADGFVAKGGDLINQLRVLFQQLFQERYQTYARESCQNPPGGRAAYNLVESNLEVPT